MTIFFSKKREISNGSNKNVCSVFSDLKSNNEKCEIAGTGVRKGVEMVLCGMECIDLTDDVIKI